MAGYSSPTAEPEKPSDRDVDDDEDAGDVKIPSHATRLAWYEEWEEQQRDNRKEQRLDRDYYDGNQLSADVLKELEARGQPPTVNNLIAKKINTLLGEEIEKRFDPSAKPRTPQHDDDARSSTDALRYVCDEQEFQRIKSEVANDFFIEGIGAALKHVDDNGKHSLRRIRADRFFYDIRSRDVPFQDARFLGFLDWMDFDEAEELWPGARAQLELADMQSGDSTNDTPRTWFTGKQGRRRALVLEMYFWAGDDCYRCHFTKAGDLGEPELSGYLDDAGKHHVCPLAAVSCYIDAEGNRYGPVRNLRSPQDALNKRESKALHALNSEGVIAEKGVIPDPEEFMDGLHAVDGYSEVAEGSFAGPNGQPRFQLRNNANLAATHFQFAQQSRQDINGIGPSASNLPELPKDASGIAQKMRRKAAALDYGTIFDHLRFWSKEIFKLDWLCIKWNWTREKWLRVTDDREETGYRWVGLNRKTTRGQRFQELLETQPPIPPEKAIKTAAGDKAPIIMAQAKQYLQMAAMQAKQMGQQPPEPSQALVQAILANPLMLEPLTVNDVAQMNVDIILDEAPDTANLQEEQFATMSEMFGLLAQAKPDLAPTLARLMVQASTLPDKRELLAAFDKAPDPQVMALQQKNAQLEVALKAAQVAQTQSVAQLNQAKTQAELAQLNTPEAPQMPEPPDPLRHAQAQREQVNTQLDVVKTRAHVERDQAMTMKHKVDTAAAIKTMNEPLQARQAPEAPQ
jgi:hypothetical protein